MEAIDEGKISFDDKVVASEHAVSMGGTQIYLELGETMTVHELLKAVAVPSANDAAVALAEHIAGSETECKKQSRRQRQQNFHKISFHDVLHFEFVNFIRISPLFSW